MSSKKASTARLLNWATKDVTKLVVRGGLMVKILALDLVSQGLSPTSQGFFLSFPFCLTSMPWSSLISTPSNEEVFHCILWRGCKAVGPGIPGSISLWPFQALVSHYYSGKPVRVP